MADPTARPDGRRPDELRPVGFQPGFVETATGSTLVTVGRTRVICTASVEEGVPPWRRGQGLGWLTAEYGMLPASTGERRARESTRGKVDGRTQEIQRLIGRSLRAVTDLAALGERTVWVDCDVLTADGGTRCASICGAYVALELALRSLVADGRLRDVPLRDSVAAVSVGIVGGRPRLDLAYLEDAAAEVDMNVVMTGTGRLVEVQATGEEATFSRDELDAMLSLAAGGVAELRALQERAVAVPVPVAE
ncbi:MAG: ribonuclease PH [Actinomycetota bacterium]